MPAGKSKDKDSKRHKNPAAVALGRLGGRKNGWRKYLASLTPEAKSARQRMAVMQRWHPDKKPASS